VLSPPRNLLSFEEDEMFQDPTIFFCYNHMLKLKPWLWSPWFHLLYKYFPRLNISLMMKH
jgi:hypothetical protein